jgi:hypothetical protein
MIFSKEYLMKRQKFNKNIKFNINFDLYLLMY